MRVSRASECWSSSCCGSQFHDNVLTDGASHDSPHRHMPGPPASVTVRIRLRRIYLGIAVRRLCRCMRPFRTMVFGRPSAYSCVMPAISRALATQRDVTVGFAQYPMFDVLHNWIVVGANAYVE
jgi:hypothetical protein